MCRKQKLCYAKRKICIKSREVDVQKYSIVLRKAASKEKQLRKLEQLREAAVLR